MPVSGPTVWLVRCSCGLTLGYSMSIASTVGFIALGGVASEIAVVMLVYINQAITTRTREGKLNSLSERIEGIVEGAALRMWVAAPAPR